jgi:hypothetical protein
LPPAYGLAPKRTYRAPPIAGFTTVVAAVVAARVRTLLLGKCGPHPSPASNARLAIMPKILPKTVKSQSLKFNVFCGFRAV